jgi:glycosyltransferase involved in cell wall biosynthesis
VNRRAQSGMGRSDDHDARVAALVSVIIPVFNGERFLAEAIDSVLGQDHRPIEIVVIDDGSTDGSKRVAGRFHDVILIASANHGVAAARNLGLARASGSFITFLDADDLMASGRLTAQLEHLRTRPDVGCVLMRQELLFEPGVTHQVWRPDGPAGGVPPMTGLLRRQASELVGGFDPSYRVVEDTEWLFRLRDAGVQIDILPRVGVIRRIHRDNLTHQVALMRNELARSLMERIRRARADRSTGT